jgi:hypothetical protein
MRSPHPTDRPTATPQRGPTDKGEGGGVRCATAHENQKTAQTTRSLGEKGEGEKETGLGDQREPKAERTDEGQGSAKEKTDGQRAPGCRPA